MKQKLLLYLSNLSNNVFSERIKQKIVVFHYMTHLVLLKH